MPDVSQSAEFTNRRQWGLLYFLNLIMLIFAGGLLAFVLYQMNVLHIREIAITEREAMLADASISVDEVADIAGRIEAAEENAKFYLSIFESISFWVSMIGILVVALGLFAAVIGVSNFTEMRENLENTRKELEKQQNEANQRIANEIARLGGLETQNQSRLEEFSEARRSLSQLADDFEKNSQQETEKLLDTYQKNRLAFTLVSLAERDLRSHNIKSALNTLKRALELEEDNPLAHYYLGINLTSVEELEESRLHLERALEVDSDFHHARAALGFTIRRIGEQKEGKERERYFKQAEDLMLEALAKDQALVDFEGESWYGALGGLYRRQNRIDDAIYCYRKAEQVTPVSSYPVSNLGRLALQCGADNVLELYKKVARLAKREINLDLGNYWAYSDLVSSQLILADKQIDENLEALLEAIPQGVTDVLPRIIETVSDIKTAATFKGDGRDMAKIDAVLQRLNQVAYPNGKGES